MNGGFWTGKSGRRGLAGFFILILLLGTASREGFAHARTYVWTQEYKTLPKGAFELENHTTSKVPRWTASNENSWNYEQELEYGVTDRLNIAHYEIWETRNQAGLDDNGVPNKDVTKYSGFKFETKYRIGETGKYWVDPLLYFEYAYDPRERFEGAPHVLEGKLILSKDFGKWNATYNQSIESGLGHKGRTEHEFFFGLNYEIFPEARVGVETKGQYWKPGSNRNELALGPTVAYEAKYFWIAAGILFGVNHEADDFQANVSVGVPIG